jgi:hypothetical protein
MLQIYNKGVATSPATLLQMYNESKAIFPFLPTTQQTCTIQPLKQPQAYLLQGLLLLLLLTQPMLVPEGTSVVRCNPQVWISQLLGSTCSLRTQFYKIHSSSLCQSLSIMHHSCILDGVIFHNPNFSFPRQVPFQASLGAFN